MKRVKQLALAVLAALALSVVGASSASAAGFLTSNLWYPAELTGAAPEKQTMTAPGVKTFTCTGGNFLGEVDDILASTSLDATPGERKCESSGFPKSALQMNGCSFHFDPGTENPATHQFEGTWDIGPPSCGPMLLIGSGSCRFNIYPEAGMPATYTNEGTGSSATVSIDVSKSQLAYWMTGPESGCPITKGENLQLGISWKVSAKAFGAATGLRLDRIPNGIQVVGKGSEGEGPRIEAEAYPASLDATNEQKIGANEEYFYVPVSARKMECERTDFAAVLTGPTATLPLDTTYSGSCRASGTLVIDVRMNSCDYVLNVLNAGPPYTGSYDIECAKEGDTIEFDMWNIFHTEVACTTKIGSQSSLTSVKINNAPEGEWWIPRVILDVNLKSIEYTQTSNHNSFCGQTKGTTKTYKDGTYTTDVTLRGWLDS